MNYHEESWIFSTYSLHLAKRHSATLMNSKKEKAMKMAKFCEDHAPKIFLDHIDFEV